MSGIIVSMFFSGCAPLSRLRAGDTISHSSGFDFVIPPNVPNLRTYNLGEYNRDENKLLQIYSKPSSSSRFNIEMWQYKKSDLEILEVSYGFRNSLAQFVNLPRKDRVDQFDELEVDGIQSWGILNDRDNRIDSYTVFFEIDEDIFVIRYAVTKGDMVLFQKVFDQFVESIDFDK